MAHSLYITGTEGEWENRSHLGADAFLQSQVRKVAFFRPIIDSEDEARRDSSINLILSILSWICCIGTPTRVPIRKRSNW